MRKILIHVNQHHIKHNMLLMKEGGSPYDKHVMTVKDYRSNRKGQTVILRDETGREVARFVYRPDKPLSCGAKVWFESNVLTAEVCDEHGFPIPLDDIEFVESEECLLTS